MRRSFAFSEDDFRHTDAEGAVVVDFGESQIFEWEMAELLDGFVGREFPTADLLEQFADGVRVHRLLVLRSLFSVLSAANVQISIS